MLFPLSVGRLKGDTLECAGHGWRFSLKSGKAIFPPIRQGLTFYEVEIRQGEIWAKVTPLY
jgi:nitrite reductase/ring-hydroxylating ferredoxin subunit